MRRLLTGLLLAAALTGTAAAAQPARVLAVEWEAGGGKLRWVSPTTLRPVGPAVLNVGGAPAEVVATSPDGSIAAIGGGADGRLRFVRLDELRQTGLMRLGEGSVFRGIWASPDRLVVLLGGSPATIVVVDPTTRRVVSRAPLPGAVTGVARAGSRLVTLLTRPNEIGPARLAIIGADGLARMVDLPGIQAGWTHPSTPEGIARGASPGFASNGALAVVVGRESLVTVDLESLAVESRALVARSTAKRIESWGRKVVWLGEGRIAISGWVSDAEGSTGIGVQTGDLADGSMWTLDADATEATRAGSTLLVHGGGALHGYRLDGTLRFTTLRGADTGYVQTSGRWAYVGSQNSTRFAVVDVQKGRVVGRVVTAKPTVLLSP